MGTRPFSELGAVVRKGVRVAWSVGPLLRPRVSMESNKVLR